MSRCPFNKKDSFGCHWKYLTATSRICTYLTENQECRVECSYGDMTEFDLKARIQELEIELQTMRNCADVVKVVRCKDCKHGKSLDRTKLPFKYYKDSCVLCECEDVVCEEPMVYLPEHFCSYGERKG